MRVTGSTPSFQESAPDIDPDDSDITTTTLHTGRHDPTYVHGIDAEPLNEDEEEYEEVVIIKRRRKKRDENKSEVDVKQEKKTETTGIATPISTISTTAIATSTTPTETEESATTTGITTATSAPTTSTSADTATNKTVPSSVAPGSTTSFSSRPSSLTSVQDPPFTSTYRYLFLRAFLIFSLFLLFQHLYDKYYWIPHHRPHHTPEHDAKIKQQIQDKIRSQMCPPGVECSYQLPQDYELNWKKGEVVGHEPKEAAIHQEHVIDPAVEAELQREMERYEREQNTGKSGDTKKYKKEKKSKSQKKKEKKEKKKERKGRRGVEIDDL